jgi:predicted DNA binding CopG/RHH family protein
MEVKFMDRNNTTEDARFKLDDEERALENALERGEFEETMSREEAQKDWSDVLANTMRKSQVTFRVSESVIDKLKVRAMREGIPYQTLVHSILHKYVTGQLKERD